MRQIAISRSRPRPPIAWLFTGMTGIVQRTYPSNAASLIPKVSTADPARQHPPTQLRGEAFLARGLLPQHGCLAQTDALKKGHGMPRRFVPLPCDAVRFFQLRGAVIGGEGESREDASALWTSGASKQLKCGAVAHNCAGDVAAQMGDQAQIPDRGGFVELRVAGSVELHGFFKQIGSFPIAILLDAQQGQIPA